MATDAKATANDSRPLELVDIAKAAAGFFGAGLTVVGVVTVTGGAILWARFSAAGLPADQAVAAVPDAELIAVGAGRLLRYAFIALVALVFLYVVDPTGLDDTPERSKEPRNGHPKEDIGGRESRANADGARRASALLANVWVRLAYIFLIAAFCGWTLVEAIEHLRGADQLIAVGIALILGVGSYRIARRRKGFWWFAVAAIISVLVAAAVVDWMRTKTSPEAQPAAVLVEGKRGVIGLYVAQTDDYLFLGRPRRKSRGVVLAIPKEKVSALAIGQPQSVANDRRKMLALVQARTLARRLCFQNVRSAREPRGRPQCPQLKGLSLSGTADGEALLGSAAQDVLEGRGGRDVVRGLGGSDRLYGGDSRDELFGSAGHDRVRGGNGSDRVSGGSGRDHLIGGSGQDRIFAGRGSDHVRALDEDRDLINCGPGRDRIVADRKDRLEGCERETKR
jgi:hypothetical protein